MGFLEGEILCDQKYERLRQELFRPRGLGIKQIHRKSLFTLIDLDIITGHNNYKKPPKTLIPESPFDYTVVYYHKKLGILSNYKKKIMNELRDVGTEIVEKKHYNIIPREAYYWLAKEDWAERFGMKFYTAKERKLGYKEAKRAIAKKLTVIGKSKQKELRIYVKEEKFEKMLKFLEIKLPRIEGFYDVPLITISTSKNLTENVPKEKYGVMSRVWLNTHSETSTFVSKTEEKNNILKRTLEIIGAWGGEEDIFANTKFVNFATDIRAKNVFDEFKKQVLGAKTDFDYEIIKQQLLFH